MILGVAMLTAPAFGRRFGGVSIFFGMIGVVGVVAGLFAAGDTGMQLIGIAAFSNIIFLPIFGWKVYRMSRDTTKS
jgi:ABC-type Co2+ transport system permease subunit